MVTYKSLYASTYRLHSQKENKEALIKQCPHNEMELKEMKAENKF